MTTRFIGRPDWYNTSNPETLAATGATLRWGFVATGGIARTVAKDLALLEDAALQAVSSRGQSSAEAFAQEFGFAAHYYDGGRDGSAGTGYEQLVRDPNVDVVYIATPHAQHYDIAKAAIENGKHVLCEKALTVTAAEARGLIELAREHNVFLMEAVWARFVPGVQRALEIIASGEIGAVKWVQGHFGFALAEDPSLRLWAHADGGGALLDLSVYPLLWAWATLGAPEQVSATGVVTESGVDAMNTMTLSYTNGAQAQFISHLTSQAPSRATISGTGGYIETVHSLHNPREIIVSTPEGTRTESFEWPGHGYTYELREVTRCIQAGLTDSTTMPQADSLAILELFDEVRRQLGTVYPNDTRTDLSS